MSDVIHLLEKDGTVSTLLAEDVRATKHLPGDTDVHADTDVYDDVQGDVQGDVPDDVQALASALLASEELIIEFAAADGRGFSLAKGVRDLGFDGGLYAAGAINPDQLAMAFQTGFDGVLVTAEDWQVYGATAWRNAVSPRVELSYAATHSPSHRSIWQLRHGNRG